MKIKTQSLITLLVLCSLLSVQAGCSSKSASSPGTTISSSSASVTRDTIFALYNKVQLDQNKTQIDAALGGSGEVDANDPKSYDYMDKNEEYGVIVLYDDKKKATAKSLVYPAHKDIAFLTSKAVTEDQTKQVQKGMSYDEVKVILGGEGTEVNATEIPYYNNKIGYMYRWVNKDGSFIQVVMSPEGKVASVQYFKDQG